MQSVSHSKPVTAHQRTIWTVQAGIIAALYLVLTLLAAGFDLASGAIQVRFSEALTILPYFTPAAVPGLAVGCLIANFVTGSALPDVVFGTHSDLCLWRAGRLPLPGGHGRRRGGGLLYSVRSDSDQRPETGAESDIRADVSMKSVSVFCAPEWRGNSDSNRGNIHSD